MSLQILLSAFLVSIFFSNWVTICTASYTTYGSAYSVIHQPTKYRLFTSKISWSSGNQAVTASNDENEEVTLWQIREGLGSQYPGLGIPVKCGDTIRLEHPSSGMALNSETIKSMLSNQHEVSMAANETISINYVVECKDGEKGESWELNMPFRLRHEKIGGYLRSTKRYTFDHSNCPRCPIVGHREVFISNTARKSDDDFWILEERLIFNPEGGEHDDKHDEL